MAIQWISNCICWVFGYKTLSFDKLPNEIQLRILEWVLEPATTALVCRQWCDLTNSESVFRLVLRRYAQCHFLVPFINRPDLTARQQVQNVCRRIVQHALKFNADPQKIRQIKGDCYSIEFLDQVLEMHRGYDSAVVFLRLCGMVTETTLKQALQFNLIYTNAEHVDLANCHLISLPPFLGKATDLISVDISGNQVTQLCLEMKNLVKLSSLNLRNNPLDLENVKIICQSLPLLAQVIVGHEDTALIELFKTSFPRLELIEQTYYVDAEPI